MDSDTPKTNDPDASLERSFMEEFLQSTGHSLADLHTLPSDQMTVLMKQASRYASGRLTEVESRAHYVESIHGDTDLKGRG